MPAVGAAVIASGAASAQLSRRVQGLLAWLDMDQKALDDAYDQAVYAPNRDQVHKRNMFNSDRVRARLGAPKRIAYGPKPIEQLDLFATSEAERADQRVHPRRRLAAARGQGLRLHGRDGRARRRALDRARLRRRRGHQRRSPADGGSGSPRASPGLVRTPRAFGRRPNRIYKSGQSSCRHLRRLRRHHRLEGLRRAGRHREGRAALLGHVRTSLMAVEVPDTSRPSPTRPRRSCPRSAASTGSTAR